MMRIYYICVILLIMPLAGGCGLQPVYGTQDHRQHLAAVQIEPINDRLGQMLHNRLIELQGTGRKPVEYILRSRVSEQTTRLSVTRDGKVTLANLVVTLSYQLSEAGSGKSVSEGRIKGQTSYDLIDSPVARINADRQAKQVLAQNLARRLSIRLSTALNRIDGP